MLNYRILHRRDGTEISMHERKRIDTAKNIASMLVNSIRQDAAKTYDDVAIRSAWDRVHAITPSSFDATGCIVITCLDSTIRIDRT